MFKLESYITPILLSYVDKYIKNFRPEDSQVSLWGGDASFHNLDLRLEVLEQELHLPFSFVSGHIHELLIHVPWTKLASEPITITINTIECILKLRNAESSSVSDTSSQSRERQKKATNRKEEIETPPGYVQSLVNKIVSNIRIYCNNLILKYVEEDIVLSMNVKLLTFESANEKWEAAYTELSPAQVTLRKLITLNDLTVCLDKRNAAGKIDVYQEPMLYRCSLTMHLLRNYHSATAKRASTTRLDIYCNCMEFSVTEQQVPMLMRLIMLLLALHQKQLKQDVEVNSENAAVSSELGEPSEHEESWAGWAWSFVPSILPVAWDEEWNREQQMSYSGHTVHIGFYVDNASLTFKVSESSNDRGYYSQRKLKYWPLLALHFQGVFIDIIMHGIKWFHAACGVSQAILLPVGYCTCAHVDVPEGKQPPEYLTAGSVSASHKSDSLFDAEAIENKGQKRLYNVVWDFHTSTVTEAVMLERTPGFALDYVYQLEIPDDISSERLSELGSDLEYSNLSEKALLRIVMGPFKLRLCSGFFHRISSLQVAASAYDYPPYSVPTPDPLFNELLPASEDDYDALNNFIPMKTIQITVFAPVFEFQLMDHPYFVPFKGTLFRKRKKISIGHPQQIHTDLPKITLECQCIDVRIQSPMYVKRLVHTTCQLPAPPTHMFDACHINTSIKVIGFCSRLILATNRHTTLITPSSAAYKSKTILKPQYWLNPDISHNEITFESESITLTGTKAKMLIAYHIIDKLFKMDTDDSVNDVLNSTLLHDATKGYGMPYLELCVEGIRFKKVRTNSTITIDSSLASLRVCIFEPTEISNYNYAVNQVISIPSTLGSPFRTEIKPEQVPMFSREIQQVLFFSGPEFNENRKQSSDISDELPPLLTVTFQYPMNPEKRPHPTILVFSLQEVQICVDPLFCKWLMYKPRNITAAKSDFIDPLQRKNRNISEASGSLLETPRRVGTPHESIHSSSDREQLHIPPPVKNIKDEDSIDLQEKIYNFLKKWFDVWKGMLISGDISQCMIYFPVGSLSAVGSQGIQQAIEETINKEFPPEILVLALPNATIRSVSQKKGLASYIVDLPVKLPNNLWFPEKSSFPWTISVSDLSCYTIQYGNKWNFLKPITLSATVGLSTKSNKSDVSFGKPSNQNIDSNMPQTSFKSSENENIQKEIFVETFKSDIGSLGVCIHIDMSPIAISTSEVQVCLIASILYGLSDVIRTLAPESSKETLKSPDVPPFASVRSPTVSPTLLRDSTIESISERSPPIAIKTDGMENENVKLTAWIQWTIARFTLELLSHETQDIFTDEMFYVHSPKLKLVVDAEDIVSSLDFQSVYLKIKSKIGSANIQHFKRNKPSSKWKPGAFLGLVMRAKEDAPIPGERREVTAFASITVTRASCHHTHSLWGTSRKYKLKENKNDQNFVKPSPARFITEIVVNLQPIDFVISLKTLRSFYMVLEPFLSSPLAPTQDKVRTNILMNFNNQNLPLAYLECHGMRIIMPSVDLGGKGDLHDVCMFQVGNFSLNPSPVNPICRTPCRPDIYQQAAQARILNIPGSDVEDRQYQLDVTGMSMNTGRWRELDPILNVSSAASNLRTMNENPALEWNNLEKGRLSITPHLHLLPVIPRFDLSVIIAPSMMYKHDTIICGHSVEVNFVSDIEINIALNQIKLASALLTEFLYIFHPFVYRDGIRIRPKIMDPYPKVDTTYLDIGEEPELETEITRDSGIDTDFKSLSVQTRPSVILSAPTHKTENDRVVSFISRHSNSQLYGYHFIPIDILFTGGKITVVLYKMDDYDQEQNKKYVGKKTQQPKVKDNETGYEASEEGSIDEKLTKKSLTFLPLFFISASQPNAFLSQMQLGNKIQLSCFDVCIKISGPDYQALKGIPVEQDFPVNLLETKSGAPNPDTGVPPSFFTLKFSRGLGKPATLDIEFGKPTRILCSISRWSYLISIKEMVIVSFKSSFEELSRSSQMSLNLSTTCKAGSANNSLSALRSHRHVENYAKFKEIKDKLYGVTVLNIKLAQILFAVKTDDGSEVNFSIGKLKSHLSISNRPERLTNIITLECLTLGVSHNDFTRLLLNPWTVSVEVGLFWESWQSSDSDPQIQISVDSDCIMIDISPQQIKCVDIVLKELKEFVSNMQFNESDDKDVPPESYKIPSLDKEQHYKDDLRAGAFQFVDSSTNNVDELPLPYQVVFWSQNVAAMAWRYPQPRALTKVRIFPVPFKISTGSQEDQQVLCHLEYWSDCHGCYQRYTQFYLSESEMCHLELPEGNPQPAVASTWRVVLSTPNYNTQSMEFDYSRVMISPRALAACMRIDSYFNKVLIPNMSVAFHISKINISLYNHFDKTTTVVMPEELKLFTPDLMFPETQCFLTVTLDGTKAYLTSWNFEMASFDINTTSQCSILDFGFLTQQTFIEPFNSKFELSLSRNFNINFLSKPIHLKFGSSIAHTLAVSVQLWEQSWKLRNPSDNLSSDLILITHYVICNDTNINLRFGQAATEEDILLPSRYCHLYAWRSQKCKQMIRVGLEENGWLWSKPFHIDQEGTEMCHITSENNLTIVVTVKSLSATQKQIIFSGQLVICNMLLEHFELKVVKAVKEDRDKEFKLTSSHIISGKSTPPSLLINSENKFFLRLRFFGLESAWSGDIPLMENTKCAQPWLVKVPLQERGQFLSIWCRIVIQEFVIGKKILAILWPLFMIRSNLPVNTKMHIETPTLNVHLESTVRGKGEFQQLYCPGTIDHSHQLRFQLDNGTPTSNPYVPLNYSLVDQRQFFKKSENEDINEILSVLNSYNLSNWPYFGEEFDGIDWIVEDQPLTHVQVRYQNACQYSSALLVELLPWCLLINTLGCPIAIIINERELCRVSHHGIVTPPKLDETFHIGVGIGGTWNMSPPLQLAKSDWSQTFYMPKITGTIPLEGTVKAAVKCGANMCMISINSSTSNEIRLMKISSTHVLTNHMMMQLEVVCLAVPDNDKVYNIPKQLDKYSFTITPQMNTSKAGISILQWHSVDTTVDSNTEYVLYISVAIDAKLGWSCPVRVDKNLTRRSIVVQTEEQSIPVVITSQEYKGQIYLSLHHDIHPQLLIKNRCGIKLFCVQFSGNDNDIYTPDCQHLKWMCTIEDCSSVYYTMPTLSEKFPDINQNGHSEKILLASDPEGDPQGYQWSTPISIMNFNDQFVRIPYYGDVKVNIIDSAHTTFVIIESVSQVEISARDIRVRLSMHESEHSAIQKKGVESTDGLKNVETKDSKSDTTLASSYFSAEDVAQTVSDTSFLATSKPLTFNLSTVIEKSTSQIFTVPPYLQRCWSDLGISKSIEFSKHQSTFSFRKDWSVLKIAAFIKSISLTFTLDLENGGAEKTEIANLTCDNIAFTATQTDQMHVCISTSEIQFDNQMFSRGSYDFPVVLIGQQPKSSQKLTSLNASAMQWINATRPNSLLITEFILETWKDEVRGKNVTDVNNLRISIQPLAAYIEDTYITKMLEYLTIFISTKLVLWTKNKEKIKYNLNSVLVGVPEIIIWESLILAKPLLIRNLLIEPLSVLLSVHSSVKLYIALDQSPLQFGRFDRRRIITTPYRLGHALTMHYLSGAIFGAGWVVGSLELIGSPGGLARAMGSGLRDFVSMPYRGLVQGPWAFLRGVTHGSASLMKHVTAGTLQSVTKLASSVARNLDRLTLDEEHLRRTEEQRRQRPQGVAQGFMQGLTGLGISLLGAVGGIAHHPLQSVMTEGASPRSLAAGVGLGLVGVFTKPLSGAAELVALTGQGLLQGAGWNPLPEPRMNPVLNHMYSSTNSILKYSWKFVQSITHSNLLFVTEATCIKSLSQYEAVALILTTEALIIVNTDEDVTQRIVSLTDLHGMDSSADPTLLSFKLKPAIITSKSTDECTVDMDPACRARVADYVRSTVGLIQMPDDGSSEQSEMGISPMQSPRSVSIDERNSEQTMLTFYVNPQSRNYFLSLLSLAKQQCHNDNFHIF